MQPQNLCKLLILVKSFIAPYQLLMCKIKSLLHPVPNADEIEMPQSRQFERS